MQRTTDLEQVIDGAEFSHGTVCKIHEIGPYAIIEYNPWLETREGSSRVGVVDPDNTHHLFFCYADGRSIGQATGTLEAALAHCIAYKHDQRGPNSQAAFYFCKMIGVGL